MITDHQDLFNKYVEAELNFIWEYSGDIDKSRQKLKEEVKEYAERNNLSVDWSGFPSNEENEE